MKYFKKDFDFVAKNLANKIRNILKKLELYKSELYISNH